MITKLQHVFSKDLCTSCQCPIDNRILILIEEDDTTNRSRIVPPGFDPLDSSKVFYCNNSSRKDIYHIAVDGCLLTPQTGYNGRKCDFIVFDTVKFCFVELKTNVVSDKLKQQKKKVKDAIEQLGITIDEFDRRGVDFSSHELFAIVVMQTPKYPRNSAAKTTRKVKFFEEFQVDLIEQNFFEF